MVGPKNLPWTAEASGTDLYDSEIFGKDGTLPVLIGEIMDKDEAAFLVRAVNAHDDLVEALEACASILPRYHMAGKTTGDDEELDAVLERVNEALSAADRARVKVGA